jgi:geranylgeranyl pyrophosphate synthase
MDDLLDAKGDTDKMGKTASKDKNQGKPNILAVMPIEKATLLAKQLINNAKSNISVLQEQAEPLITLADYILARES